jgi:hypothetical protein
MSDELQTQPTAPALANPSIARCCEAKTAAHRAAAAKRQSDYQCAVAAREAYRKAMPPLTGPDNIRDFIACVAHGMLIGVLTTSDSTRLLYAAQVAGGMAVKNQPAKGR